MYRGEEALETRSPNNPRWARVCKSVFALCVLVLFALGCFISLCCKYSPILDVAPYTCATFHNEVLHKDCTVQYYVYKL